MFLPPWAKNLKHSSIDSAVIIWSYSQHTAKNSVYSITPVLLKSRYSILVLGGKDLWEMMPMNLNTALSPGSSEWGILSVWNSKVAFRSKFVQLKSLSFTWHFYNRFWSAPVRGRALLLIQASFKAYLALILLASLKLSTLAINSRQSLLMELSK